MIQNTYYTPQWIHVLDFDIKIAIHLILGYHQWDEEQDMEKQLKVGDPHCLPLYFYILNFEF